MLYKVFFTFSFLEDKAEQVDILSMSEKNFEKNQNTEVQHMFSWEESSQPELNSFCIHCWPR